MNVGQLKFKIIDSDEYIKIEFKNDELVLTGERDEIIFNRDETKLLKQYLEDHLK